MYLRRGVPVRMAWGVLLSCLLSWGAFAQPDYASDVRPIFERSCYTCHGPEDQKSQYRLDVRQVALKGGAHGEGAIVPHDAAGSPLFRFVSGADAALRMPPEGSGVPPLSMAEVETLRAWIDAGPSWPEAFAGEVRAEEVHWSLRPLVRPGIPGEAANPIDMFVCAKLAAQELDASPEADRRTLIRRVSYDLVGLPPTPEEVEAFVADPDPDAYGKLVDRLLASPRHGERWARHWLDTIHFADSHGYEHDIGRDQAWRYRDYVIAALNNDTPYPRFIREQLAADVFYPDETDLTPALGFLGAGTWDLSTYATAPVTFDYLDRDDMVTQTMSALVSTTANCARCHAHKFDPISQEDYYALQAVFSGVLKGDVPYDTDPEVAHARKRWQGLKTAAEAQDAAALLTPENDTLVRDWLARRGAGAAWTPLEAETYVSTQGATLTREAKGVIVSGGTKPDTDTYAITATSPLENITALRLEVMPHDSLPMRGPGRNDNGNFHLSEIEMLVFDAGGSAPRAVTFRHASADFNQTDWGIARAVDGDLKTAWGIHPEVGVAHEAVFELAESLQLAPGARLVVSLKQAHGSGHVIGAFRLSISADGSEPTEALPATLNEALAVPETERNEAQRTEIAGAVLSVVAERALAALPDQARVFAAGKRVLLVEGAATQKEGVLAEPKTVHRLERGDFDKPREEVQPGALSALNHLPARFPIEDPKNEGERRAALADWILHPNNVLAWRSIVNRVWHYHFGQGLCDTPSDFGEMGGTPSHPELIDWLAVWFRDDAKGSLKALHRLIVTSAAYRQSSAYREDAAALDGDNRLLWRQNRQRLDADAYRDFTLAVSGRLDLTMGGPGVRHFSESPGPQLTPTLDYAAYDWSTAGAGRRSIYSFVWRGIADPFMEALDFPDLGLLSPTRGFSASSLQALTLFNNAFVLEHSMALAQRVESEAADLEARIDRALRLVWLRAPEEAERAMFRGFAESKGLPALCRLLLNSNEFLFVE